MSEKVLLIDDEQDFLDTMAERMRLRDMEVLTATSTDEALQLIEENQFDAILLDLQMPGTDGIESLKMLRATNPELQVIFLTGHATVEKGIEAMRLGAMDFVEKPADLNELSEKIRKAHARKMLLVEKSLEQKLNDILQTKAW